MKHAAAIALLLSGIAVAACEAQTSEPEPEVVAAVEQSLSLVPRPPWAAGDQKGMANTQGYGTRLRCAAHLIDPRSRTYELSHERSETMPVSPFGVPLDYTFRPTSSVPFTRHAFNGETVCGEPAAQGTQMDALGHFAVMPAPWDPASGPIPVGTAQYYGGYTQAQVKPTPDSPLLKLGVENVPPIVTSAVLLDARTYLGGGNRLAPGQIITANDIKGMIQAQGLGWRGLLPGDVLYIYTGWEDLWQDPDMLHEYYTKGPGLASDAAIYIGSKAVVLVALDNPFTDPVREGQLTGAAPPPDGTPPGLPFFIHHYNLTQSGVLQIQNAHLEEMAADGTWLSCTMILPLRERGGSGSPVRPVAFGSPTR
ncbi:MAG TPA: cyclase family protein [Polyangiaceae bacterium]